MWLRRSRLSVQGFAGHKYANIDLGRKFRHAGILVFRAVHVTW